jgi:hypothetical protein
VFPVVQTGLLGSGGKLLAEVAVGGVGESVGHLLDQGQGPGEQLLLQTLAALVACLDRLRE